MEMDCNTSLISLSLTERAKSFSVNGRRGRASEVGDPKFDFRRKLVNVRLERDTIVVYFATKHKLFLSVSRITSRLINLLNNIVLYNILIAFTILGNNYDLLSTHNITVLSRDEDSNF